MLSAVRALAKLGGPEDVDTLVEAADNGFGELAAADGLPRAKVINAEVRGQG